MSDIRPSQTPLDDQYKAGLATRKKVLGNDYVERSYAKRTPFTAELQDFVTRTAWGTVWQREGLSLRDRSLITCAFAAALCRTHELKLHVRGALNNGVTPDELKELCIHLSQYAGFPAALEAFRAAAEVVEGEAGAQK